MATAIDEWKDKAIAYLHGNNRQESGHILKILKTTLVSIIDRMEAGDDREYISLKIDELP